MPNGSSGGDSGAPRLSVVVPTPRFAAPLARNLALLVERGGLPPGAFEAVVALSGMRRDDAPADGAIPGVRFVASADDLGRAGARNLALEHARGDRILFLDADCEPHAGLLAEHLEAGAREPDRAVLGRVAFPDAAGLTCVDHAFDTASWFTDLPDGADLDFVKFITANLSVPAGPLAACGGFSPAFSGWGLEDLELGYRLETLAGMRVRYRAAAAVTHAAGTPLPEWLDRFAQKGRNAVRLAILHPAVRDRLDLPVDEVMARYDDPDFFPGPAMLEDMRVSCEELEATGAWRDNAAFRAMVVDFYRNLARHIERRAAREELSARLKTATVVILAKHSLRHVLKTYGSVLANRYPEALVRVVIYDPNGLPGVADFFAAHRAPVPLRHLTGDEAALKRLFRTGDDDGEIVLFLDDTLRASRGWLLSAALAHEAGLEKARGAVLPDTPLGRYLAERRLFLPEAAVETKNLNLSFTRPALVDKSEADLTAGVWHDLVALREVDGMVARMFTDPWRLARLARGASDGAGRRQSPWRLLLSLPSALRDAARLKARGTPLPDALLFPLFDRIRRLAQGSPAAPVARPAGSAAP